MEVVANDIIHVGRDINLSVHFVKLGEKKLCVSFTVINQRMASVSTETLGL